MRIVQIIDSLEIGGAEKMAVNYANALADKIEFSGLIATRLEGDLKGQLSEKVDYLYLAKKRAFDLGAALRLKKYCKTHQVEVLQAHSSSYFIAFLTKLMYPKIQLIWHDHNGILALITLRQTIALKMTSWFFHGIIAVNSELESWSKQKLNCKKVIYLPNFTSVKVFEKAETHLQGLEGKRILCLANLRPQKNHFLLLEVAVKIKKQFPEWTFHLVGKDFNDTYSDQLKNAIAEKNLETTVFVYGSKNDTVHIINQCEIAILTSDSEGLPVALIEYGLLKKPVVATDVGEIPSIIVHGSNGFLVSAGNAVIFADFLMKLIEDKAMSNKLGEALYATVAKSNSEEGVITQYLNWLKNDNGN
ncbi:glycosyltransferase [Flavobacterium sp. XGLA_31]|uniref:glycosyltransferase n=1 Tax=Flavobacterium sp. XGLA_31 TaxID=3447666 RepID=UPI003F33EC8C